MYVCVCVGSCLSLLDGVVYFCNSCICAGCVFTWESRMLSHEPQGLALGSMHGGPRDLRTSVQNQLHSGWSLDGAAETWRERQALTIVRGRPWQCWGPGRPSFHCPVAAVVVLGSCTHAPAPSFYTTTQQPFICCLRPWIATKPAARTSALLASGPDVPFNVGGSQLCHL